MANSVLSLPKEDYPEWYNQLALKAELAEDVRQG
jgi:hypothetical protein